MKGFKCSVTMLAIFLFLTGGLNFQSIAKNVEGNQSGEWTLSNSPYIIEGDVTVPSGQSLTIEPGVVIQFSGNYRITIRGSLFANGNSTDRIIFTSINDFEFGNSATTAARNTSAKVDDWNMLEFLDDNGQQSSTLSYCLFRYSANIIQCRNATPNIRNIIITDCKNSNLFLNGEIKSIIQGQEIDLPVPKSKNSRISSEPSSELDDVFEDVFEGEEFTFGEIKVITASKQEEKISEAPGVITVVTKDELERFGGTTLKDILERVPSLIGTSAYMTDRSMISARGNQIKCTSSHVLLLINGRPIREVLESDIKSEIYESFPVNIIEKIEVIKGPGSVLYGTNAFTAVINVITQKATNNSLTITGLGGNSSAYGTLGKIMFQKGDLGIVAAARYYQKAEWETNVLYAIPDTNLVMNNHLTIPNKGPGGYIGLDYKNFRFQGSYNQWQHSYFVSDFLWIGNIHWKKGFADLGYTHKISEKWRMDFNVTYSRAHLKVSSWPHIERDSYEVVTEWMNALNLSEKLHIVLGGLYNYIAGEEIFLAGPEPMAISDEHRTSFGLYTQMDYRLHQNLKAIGGFQANKVENLDLDVVPRAGLIWSPFSKINIKTLYSQAFRAPSINEFGLNHPAMQGNPQVKSEKVSTIDLGVNFQGEQLQGGINYFYSKLTDIIYQDRSGKYELPTYDNIGEVEFQGIEVEAKYYLNQAFFLTGSILYQTNKDKAGVKNVTPIGNFGAKGGISYKSNKGLTLSLFNIYQSALDPKFDTQFNPSPEAYHLMNLHGRLNLKRYLNYDLSVLLQVDNLLNKEIWFPDWGLIIGKSMPVNQGRAIYLGLETALD